jgi:hypothetical protein
MDFVGMVGSQVIDQVDVRSMLEGVVVRVQVAVIVVEELPVMAG